MTCFYKSIFSVLALFFSALVVSAQNSNPKGITVITHGFQLSGIIDEGWIEFAAAIKARAGNGATIYTNNLQTGRWERVILSSNLIDKYGPNGLGNVQEELIFVYNWASVSNIFDDGPLESSADHLFSLLSSIPVYDNLSPTKINLWTSSKPVHLISHSRGTILQLQLCYRVAKLYPNRNIEQYTSLDPHPATLMNDVNIRSQTISLPGTIGVPENCGDIVGCSSPGDLQLLLPFNVLKADNYYREDGNYESWNLFPNNDIADFDGLPNQSLNQFNRKLKNRVLDPIFTGIESAHSNVHQWYLGTIDTLKTKYDGNTKDIPLDWYSINNGQNEISESPSFSERRGRTGYFYSRLGGGYSQLENVGASSSLADMDSRIVARTGVQFQNIFNGNFQYGHFGWTSTASDLQTGIITQGEQLNLGSGLTKALHNYFLFPTNQSFVKFKVKSFSRISGSVSNFPKVRITFHNEDGGQIDYRETIVDHDYYKTLYFQIPTILLGKMGTIQFNFLSDNNEKELLIDDIETSITAPLPTALAFAEGSTSLCGSQTVKLFCSTSADYVYQWQRDSVNISDATDSVYIASQPGAYRVRVTQVSNGLSTLSEPVNVQSGSLNINVFSNSPVVVGQTISLNASGAETYSWQGPNGFVSTLPSPQIPSAVTTDYGSFTVIGTTGKCTGSAVINITVGTPIGNCPPLVRSGSVISTSIGNVIGINEVYSIPTINDAYIVVLSSNNTLSLAKLDSSLNLIWKQPISSTPSEILPNIYGDIFLRTSNSISKYDSYGVLEWNTIPSIKIVQRLRVIRPSGTTTTYTDINIPINIVSATPTLDGGVAMLFMGESYKDYTNTVRENNTNVTYEYSFTPNGGTNSQDFYVAKLNSNGNMQWFHFYGEDNTEVASQIKETKLGGYILIGKTGSNLRTIKIDASGNQLWSSQIHLNNSLDVPKNLSEAVDGGALVGLDIYRNGQYDMLFMKINSAGNLQWQKTFGGGTPDPSWPQNDDRVYNVITDAEGNFIVSGKYSSTNGDVINPTNSYRSIFWLAKITNDGITKWSKKYDTEFSHIFLHGNKLKATGLNTIYNMYDFNLANFGRNQIENLCQDYIRLEVSIEPWNGRVPNYANYHWYRNGVELTNSSTGLNIFPNSSSQNSDGTYYLKLDLNNGCSVTTPTITVNSPKISSNSIICERQTLELKAEGGDTYTWSGPSSFTSNQQNPKILNAMVVNQGTYTVVINNLKRNCITTLTTNVGIRSTPLFSIIRNDLGSNQQTNFTAEEGKNIRLYVTPTGGSWTDSPTFTWRGPDGYTLGPVNGYIGNNEIGITDASLNNSGDYYLTIRVGNCVTTDVKRLEITPCSLSDPRITVVKTGGYSIATNFADPPFNGTPPNGLIEYCSGQGVNQSIRLTPTQTGYSSSQWFKDGQGISLPNSVTATGVYRVMLTKQGRCKLLSNSITVRPVTRPTVSYTVSTAVCQGFPLDLKAFGNASSWYWNLGYLGTFTTQNVTIPKWSQSGTNYGYLAAKGSNGCVYYSGSNSVKLDPVLPLQFGIQPSQQNTIICRGQNYGVAFQRYGTCELPATYKVSLIKVPENTVEIDDMGRGLLSPIQVLIPSNINARNYKFKLTAYIGDSLRYAESSNFFISGSTPRSLTVTSNSPVCIGGTITLAVAGALNGSSYQWTGPANFSSLISNPTVSSATVANFGLYSVNVTPSSGCSTFGFVTVSSGTNGVVESIRSGNWNAATTWSCGQLPTILDTVIINSGHIINIDTNPAEAKRIQYKGGTVKFNGNNILKLGPN